MSFFELLEEKAKKEGIIKKVVGGVILNSKGQVLMLKRKEDDFYGGILELPSGNMEDGENIKDTLIREIEEETALKVNKIYSYINAFDYSSGSGKKARQFNFQVAVDETENIELTEHNEYKWVNLENVDNEKEVTDEVKFLLNILKFNKENQ